MEPSNNLFQAARQDEIPSFPTHMTSDIETNGVDIFTTLRNLAAGNAATSDSQMLLPKEVPSSNSASWSTCSNNWLDQAKFSLLPMYGLLQTSVNNSSDVTSNMDLPLLFDQNFQQSAISAAASLNVMENIQSFGQIYGGMKSNFASNMQSHLNAFDQIQPSTSMQTYPNSISNAPQSSQTSAQNEMLLSQMDNQSMDQIKQNYMQNNSTSLEQSIEEFGEFDLTDFQNILMDKPTSSSEPFAQPEPMNNDSVYSHGDRGELIDNSEKVVKIPESISTHRYDELANADKELDRLVSLVATQNTPLDTKFDNNLEMVHGLVGLNTTNTVSTPGNSLSTLQFTPPDSPESDTQAFPANDGTKEYGRGGSGRMSTITMFNSPPNMQSLAHASGLIRSPPVVERKEPQYEIDPVRLSRLALSRKTNNNKVPIYKQNMQQHSSQHDVQRKSVFKTSASTSATDAYNFDDEFDEKPLLPISNVKQESKQPRLSLDRSSTELQMHHPKSKRKYTRKTDDIPMTFTMESEVKKEQNKQLASFLAERASKKRLVGGGNVLSAEMVTDDNVVITDVPPTASCTVARKSDDMNECLGTPMPNPGQALPKLIIRIPRRSSNETVANLTPTTSIPSEAIAADEFHRKRKKHHHKKNKDIDWTETDECRFVKRKKHKEKHHRRSHRKHEEEHRHDRKKSEKNVPAQHFAQYDDVEPPPSSFCDQEADERLQQEQHEEEPSISNAVDVAMLDRLHYFEKPTERPKKGTFLLSKEEIFSTECALWRIDNQNLLQKYVPIVQENEDGQNGNNRGTICYRNSQTYSGWCENYVENFVAIKVDYIKQSRSENIVKPLLPLSDLFPAISSFLNNNEVPVIKIELEGIQTDNEIPSSNNQQFPDHLNTFIRIMLRHCITLDFVQTLRRNNDCNSLSAINEVEVQINDVVKRTQAKAEYWLPQLVEALNSFSQLILTSLAEEDGADSDCEQSCQACLRMSLDVRYVVQLYSNEIIDGETFLLTEDGSNAHTTIDFYVCQNCANLIQKYHSAYHVRLEVFKNCEEKVESMITEHPEFTIDQIISTCMADRRWIHEISNLLTNALQY